MTRYSYKPCRCGSGETHGPLTDIHGIFVGYCCSKCEKALRARYRPEIFEDPNYATDDQIEAD